MMTAQVTLQFPLFKGSLTLERTPRFLRFTVKGPMSKGEWDALDGIDDEPTADEFIMIGELVRKGSVHIDRVVKKKKVGEWIETADYRVIDDGPGEDVLRNKVKWQQWCIERSGETILHSRQSCNNPSASDSENSAKKQS